MSVAEVFQSQYHAALSMLEQTIQRCPETLWYDDAGGNRFWQVAYHAVFYAHLYLQVDEHAFTPWERHRKDYQYLGATPTPPHEPPTIGEPYAKQDVLDYLAFCREQVDAQLPRMDMDGPSGFHWLPFSKLEQQIYNIRHLQHHVGELSGRLFEQEGIEVDWRGAGR